jgi:hypothetical protein
MLPGPFFFGGAAVKRCRSYGLACESMLGKTRAYLKTSKLPEEDADARELDEAEEVDRVVLPTNQ